MKTATTFLIGLAAGLLIAYKPKPKQTKPITQTTKPQFV